MTQFTDALHIPDTRSACDDRHLAIQRVGVKDVRYPLRLRVAGAVQQKARCGRSTSPCRPGKRARACRA